MRKLMEAALVVGVALFMTVGVVIVGAQAVGLVLLDGALIQGAVAALANYAYVPAAIVSILAYLLEYGAPKSDEPHDDS
jgi:hypothetical protein